MSDSETKPPPGQTGAPKGQPAGRGEGDTKEREGGDKKKGGEDKKDGDKKRLPWWPFVLVGLLVLGFVAYVLYIIFAPRPDVWTDDAAVTAHYAVISPRVSGQISTVPVDDNQEVRAGQVLALLDDRDFASSVASAQAAIDRDTAQVGNASANVARQPALIAEDEANVASAKARLGFSVTDARRYTNLSSTGAGTVQQRQQADTTQQQDQAALAQSQAALEASRKQMDVLLSQAKSSHGTVEADQAQLRQAELNLSYTRILAPVDGVVGQRNVEAGNVVAPGTTLMTVVPLDQVYIVANYRELDLRHVLKGQHVTVHVDAYDIYLDGVVDSIAPATGSTFAQIPANNATGNFTKIVQRLPVKIVLSPNQPAAKLLRVGFSVETTIHTGLADVAAEQTRSPDRVTVH